MTRVNDFWITYTKQTAVSQFYSNISILNVDGTEITQKTIFVNSPINYNGISYYQTDWNLIALRIQNGNLIPKQYPLINLGNVQNKIWISWISSNLNFEQGFIILIDNLQGYCSIYNELGQFLGNLEVNEILSSNVPFSLVEIISSTGLQIKTDPGIPFIYTGFFFLMLSTLVSYITYSQIWVIKSRKNIFVGGNTTRAVFDFEIEFFGLV